VQFFDWSIQDNTITLNHAAPNEAGNYSVIITSPYGSVTSIVASLTFQLPQAEWVNVQMLADGQLRMTVAGDAGRVVTLQGTFDFFHWANLGTFTNFTGTLILTNQMPSGRNAYFYRTVQQQSVSTISVSAPHFSSATLLPSRNVMLQMNGVPGTVWQLQGSPDLAHWGNYGLFTNQTGIQTITNTPFGGGNSYFYRLKQP